jgi:pimeloyl-ACP methyl ester carboxylesterase
MHPRIEPYDRGMLDVGDGNRVYWETCGNPDGQPALVVHGGPGLGLLDRDAPPVRPRAVAAIGRALDAVARR